MTATDLSDRDALAAQVAHIRPGDTVTVLTQHPDDDEPVTVTGKVTEMFGSSLRVGCVTIRLQDGSPGVRLMAVLHHEPGPATVADLDALRRLAEDATPGEMYAGGVKAQQFRDAADPPTVLALLDDLDRAEAEVKRLREGVVSLRDHWQSCWCGPQVAPDHDPRRQDCPERGDESAEYFSGGFAATLTRLLDGGDDQ